MRVTFIFLIWNVDFLVLFFRFCVGDMLSSFVSKHFSSCCWPHRGCWGLNTNLWSTMWCPQCKLPSCVFWRTTLSNFLCESQFETERSYVTNFLIRRILMNIKISNTKTNIVLLIRFQCLGNISVKHYHILKFIW